MRDFESSRPFEPMDHYTLMASIATSSAGINELFATPGLTSKLFLLDWLHIVDLGVASDFLGNLFWHLVNSNVFDGANQRERVSSLFAFVQDYYRRNKVENRLPTLTVLMLRKKIASLLN